MKHVAQIRKPSLETDGRESQCAGATAPSSAFERHFAVTEVAKLWGLSEDVIRRLFKNEPGVFVLGDWQPRGRKHGYTTLRIPESIVARVYFKLTIS